ncbi:MAG: 3'-5' exonuclease [Muribaculaceae bacterium]|uniref:3'-5' exonuclease n=1 Tax=Chryseobacterium sp. TaxID=1871047 RepID=UPI002FCBC6DB
MAKKDWMIKESEIDDDQLRVLQATLGKSCVVAGCAGSGKSVLALIKAQRIQKELGNNYKVIVYTKALCRYMNAGKESLELNNDFCYLHDYKKYNYPSADYIIVDEIQDFVEEEIESFIKAAKKNYFFYGDTAQSIYSKFRNTVKVEDIKNINAANNPKWFELYRNYRLPKGVAKITQFIGVDLDGYDDNIYKNAYPGIPRFIRYQSIEEQIKSIVSIIKRDTLDDVAILLPHNQSVRSISGLLNQLGLSHEVKYKDDDWRNNVDTLDFTTTNPKVMTFHSAKGLQFETIFLPSIGGRTLDNDDRKALYVAMTRTYKDLYIMYSYGLPEPFNLVPGELFKTSEVDVIDDM